MGEAGWLPVEIAAYLLGRPTALSSPSLEWQSEDLEKWLDATELPWLLCAPALDEVFNEYADLFDRRASDWAFIVDLFFKAAGSLLRTQDSLTVFTTPHAVVATRRRFPLSTLIAFSPSANGVVSALAPTEVREILARGCSDPHVHQGAAIGFESAVRAAVLSLWDLGEKEAEVENSIKVTIDSGTEFAKELLALPLLAGMAIAILYNRQDVSDYGALVLSAAQGDIDAWATLRDAIGRSDRIVHDYWPQDSVRWKRLIDDSWSRQALMLYLKCESILFRGLGQYAAGLDEFVAAFNRFALVRKLPSIPRHEYVERVVAESQSMTPGLTHIDLRLGERVFGAGAGMSEVQIRALYLEFLSAYRRLLETGCNVSLTFPLGLIKTTAQSYGPWRWDTSGLWGTVNALIAALGESNAMWVLADGIDVCGAENSVPNWVLVPALSAFSRAAASVNQCVSFRFHAGEWQWNPLHGLRRIAEACSVDMVGFRNCRVGHGLALFDDDWSSFGTQPIDELLDDMVFCYKELLGFRDSALLWRIERAIRGLATQCYGNKASWALGRDVSVFVRAYANRFDPTVLHRIAYISKNDDGCAFLGSEPSAAEQSTDNLVAMHLSTSCATRSVAEDPWAAPRLDRLRDVLFDCYELVQASLIEALVKQQATIEVCPSSNVTIGTFRGLARHPASSMLARNLQVAIGTDDPAIFHSWLADEFALLRDGGGVSLVDLDKSRQSALGLVRPRGFEEELALVKQAVEYCTQEGFS